MGRKILLADDSITIQKVVNLTFSDEGIEVITVGNGELAVRKMNEVRPDIVLADVYMPGKTGYEVCEFVKTNPQFAHIPVLLLVGAFEPFDPAEANRVKADGHLTKPFESRALVATVSKLLASAPPAPPIAAAPPVAPPIAVAPPVSIPIPQSWQPIPSDATTTKLSPEMANRYQESFSIENKQEPFRASPVMASPVTPIQASPVMASPVTPIQASPVPIQASPVTPVQASPVTPVQSSPVFSESFSNNTQEAFSSPFASATPFSSSTPEPNKVFTFDSYDFNNPPTAVEKQPEPEHLEIDRGPVFDLDSPLPPPEPTYELDISDISYNTAEQKVASQTVFDPSKEPVDSNNMAQPDNLSYGEEPEQSSAEEMNLDFQDDQFEATKIMGSPLRKATSYSSTPEVAQESQSELSLDVDNANAPTEIGYDDFTPLDLEPLDEVVYQNENHSDNVLDVSSGASSHHEEMSSYSEVDVFEPFTAEIKREPLLDVEEESPAMPTIAYPSGEALNIGGRITGSQEVARITNTIPQLAPPPIPSYQEEPSYKDEASYQEEPKVVSPPAILETPVFETTPTPPQPEQESAAFEEVASQPEQESAASAFEEDESPSQFELEQAPAGYYNEGVSLEGYDQVSEEPLADLVTIPEPEPPTYSPTAALFEEPAILTKAQQEAFETGEETIPTTEVMSAPTAFAAMGLAPDGVEASELSSEMPPQVLETPPLDESMVTETPTRKFQHISREPEFSETVVPPAQPAAVAITSIEQIPQPIIDEIARRVVEATPVLAQPVVAPAPAVAITSVEQIPQHLVDEIVRRAISQISESIVREIVWEVVPDLAEILIKKQLEKIK